jgi:hypothetical protein
MNKTLGSRLTFLALATLMTVFAMLPPKPAEAADCGTGWSYFGCCYGTRVTMKQEQTCCDNGSCYHNYRCTTLACPV